MLFEEQPEAFIVRLVLLVEMDRWTYQSAGQSAPAGFEPLAHEKGVRLYDGDERSAFEGGTVTLTS